MTRTDTSTETVRRPLTRRQTLKAAGVLGAGLVAGASGLKLGSGNGSGGTAMAASSCVLTPEKTEGPYFVDELLERSDIRLNSDGSGTSDGVPLDLTLNVVRTDDGCSVGEGVVVDIWHCDPHGLYSDVSQNGTVGQDFLRGYQVTDANGQVKFKTEFPGWYSGRAVHIHFKVRAFDGDSTTYEFTSQIFFDQGTIDTVHTLPAYDGAGTTTNAQDGIYNNDTELLITPSGNTTDGYSGEMTIGLAGLPAGSDNPGGDGGSTDTDIVAEAALVKAFVRRDKEGRRKLIARVESSEAVEVKLVLVRDGKVLARGKGRIGRGNHAVKLKLRRGVKRGPARLKAVMTDGAGNVEVDRRRVKVPGKGRA